MYAIPDTYEYYAYQRYYCKSCRTEWHSEDCETCGVNLEIHGKVTEDRCYSCDYLKDDCVRIFDGEHGEIPICIECIEQSYEV